MIHFISYFNHFFNNDHIPIVCKVFHSSESAANHTYQAGDRMP
jgi:hypothetical protein